MTMREQLDQDLNRLTTSGGPSDQTLSVAVDTEHGRLECEFAVVGAIGCDLVRCRWVTVRLADASIEMLRTVCASLAAKLIYLLEPISPIEIDGQDVVVQMRSNPPHRDDQGTSYYELLVRRSGFCLQRFSKAPGQPRSAVVAHVTREVLARLGDDFAATVAGLDES